MKNVNFSLSDNFENNACNLIYGHGARFSKGSFVKTPTRILPVSIGFSR